MYGVPLDLEAYRNELIEVQNSIRLAAIINLIAAKTLAGGFFMWLAGRIIDAFRHPDVY